MQYSFSNYRLTVVAIFLGLNAIVFAQAKHNFDVRAYGVRQGLPNSHIHQCFQDHRGLIWVLTSNTVTCFDGKHFRTVLNKGLNTDFSKNRIRFEDKDGDIWLRAQGSDTRVNHILINSISGEIRSPEDKYKNAFPENVIDANPGSQGTLWLTTTDGTLVYYSPGKKSRRVYSTNNGKAFSILHVDTVRNLIWLDLPTSTTPTPTYLLIDFEGNEIAKQAIPGAQGVFPDRQGALHYYTLNGFGAIDVKGKVWQKDFTTYIDNYDSSKESNYSLPLAWEESSGNYWVNSRNGLSFFHPNTGEKFTLSNIGDQKLPEFVYSIFIDRQGVIWLAAVGGLYKLTYKSQRFQRLLWQDPQQGLDLAKIATRSIVKDEKNGILYINGGMDFWAIKNGRLTKLLRSKMDFYGSAIDEKGQIWVGDSQLHTCKGPDDKVLTIPITRNYTIVWSILAQKNRIWLGCNNGLAYYDLYDQQIHFINHNKDAPVLYNAIIHSIKADGKGGRLWLLTEQGLFHYDPKKGIVGRYWTGGKGKFYLPVDNLRHAYIAANGTWWIASINGLLEWSPRTGVSRLFNKKQGFPDQNIYAVYADAYGYLWMSCDHGIIQFHKNSGRNRFFLPQDGITHQEFNRISHYQAKDGTLYFGSLNGVTVFHPRDFYRDFDQAPNIPLLLASAHMFSKRINDLENVEPFFLRNQKLRFSPDHLYLTLRFALLDYSKTTTTRYEYRIDGLGSRWAPSPGGILQLAGLPYGNFTIRVRARNDNGMYSGQQLTIPIEVLRPFYLQWWFLVLIVASFIAGVVVFFRYRNQRLRDRKLELEREVAIQTEKIRQDKALIEAQAVQLIQLDEAKNRFFANVTHELRTPLTLIQGPITTHLEQHGLSRKEAPLLYLAQKNSMNLLRMVNDLLDLGKLEAGKLSIHEQPVQLVQKIKLLLDSFGANASKQGIALSLDDRTTSKLTLCLDLRLLTIVLNNLLSNALKFTERGGQIILRVCEGETTIQIEVEDTGRGIHSDDLPYVFDRYFQTQQTETAYEGGSGVGLALAKEASKAMGGTLEVHSKWGQGSTFTLQFPKPETMLEIVDSTPEFEEFTDQPQETAETPIQLDNQVLSREMAQLLLVEDNEDLRLYLTQVLGLHYQVAAVANGYEAQLYLAEFIPDLIISDLMMPQVDGFQLLEWLKSGSLSSIPVIMLTARADSADRVRALRKGVDDYLVKPFVESELLARVQNLIQRQRIRLSYAAEQAKAPLEEMLDEGQIDLALKSRIKIPAALTQDEQQWLEQLEQAVITNLGNSGYTVNDLAKGVLMSRSVFYEELRRTLGLTPNEYINEIRLLKAMELFQSNPGIYSVKEMSGLVGFRDERYFSRQFKQRFGVLPSQLR